MNSVGQKFIRHFTATGFVVNNNSLLLHWHSKVKAWLPPGGHIERNEDPTEALLREVLEETGLVVEILQSEHNLGFEYPKQIPPPFTILIEDINDNEIGEHQHIDMIYFCTPTRHKDVFTDLNPGWLWVKKEDLDKGLPLKNHKGDLDIPPEDVLILASHAFKAVNLIG
ncbi:MAG: 8-oxo-dGTP pyrophosphatase MutT, NUDIX family [Chloroflexi bacterium]|jgi:8-oxo-dGTP pyrophosphatase MutT (NUDIX family)|nr:MAG: 8-oxo-dGTP pyrophosphatase MutT, NUDIX family [Chloroflexota bacterium]